MQNDVFPFHINPLLEALKKHNMVIKQEKWALRGKKTCHMHGGKSRGPKTRIGKEKARIIALKHGGYTKEAIAFHKESVALVRRSKDLLEHF